MLITALYRKWSHPADFTLMDDFDAFFMVEMQARAQEREMLRCGRPNLKSICRELSLWATAEHRRFARIPVVFHSEDMPPATVAAKQEAQDFVDFVQTKLVSPPVGHAFHTFWTLRCGGMG